MRRFLLFAVVSIGIQLLSGCQNRSGAGASPAPTPDDTLFTERSVFLTYATNPGRALALVDSAVLSGHMSDYRARFLRTMIYCRSYDEGHLDSVIILGEQLLRHDSVVNTPSEQENVLDLLISASRQCNDYQLCLRWTEQKADICRKEHEEVELLRTEAEIAFALFNLNRADEGLANIGHVIAKLNGEGSVDRMDAFFVASKRKISMLSHQGRYAEVIPVAQAILDRLAHYKQHPSSYAEDSYRLPPVPRDRANYIGFTSAQAYAALGKAYAATGDKRQARHFIALFGQCSYSHTSSGMKLILDAYQSLGDMQQVDSILDTLEQRMGADTANAEYASLLCSRALAADERGHLGESRDYWRRYAALSQSLHDSLQASRARHYSSLYQSQQQQLELAHMKSRSFRTFCLAIASLLAAILAIAAAVYLYRQRKHEQQKSLSLGRRIDQLLDAMEQEQPAGGHDADQHDKDAELKPLFEQMERLICDEKLYANAYLQRQDILNLMNISRPTLNQLLNTFANGISFPAYVNTIRLKAACEMLRQEPDKTATAIAEEVGLTQHNLHRLFKQHFNQTPLQYRQAHSQH